MAHFLDDLPFEELDSCCQKEVLERRKKAEIGAQLRQVDRSHTRLDIRAHILCDVTKNISCSCCKASTDYAKLAEQRRLTSTSLKSEEIDQTNDANCDRGETDDDSENDELLNDFLSPSEQERKAQFEKRIINSETAYRLGFATHLEDSIQHVTADIQVGFPLVLHLYSPSSTRCANLDLLFEKICLRYIGTKFRRLPIVQLNQLETALHSVIPSGNINCLSSVDTNGRILCFAGQQLLACSDSLCIFSGNSEEVYKDEVIRYLENAHVLETSPVAPDLYSRYQHLRLGTSFNDSWFVNETEAGLQGDGSIDDDEGFHCDDPSCTRRYPHEHVGEGRPGTYLMQGFNNASVRCSNSNDVTGLNNLETIFAPNSLGRV